MGFVKALFGLLGGGGASIAGAVGAAIKGRSERKQTAANAQAKIALLKAGTDAKIELSETELQALRVGQMAGTWKDEYALLLVSAPLVVILLESVGVPFVAPGTGDRMVAAISNLLGDTLEYGHLLGAALASSLGLRWKRLGM